MSALISVDRYLAQSWFLVYKNIEQWWSNFPEVADKNSPKYCRPKPQLLLSKTHPNDPTCLGILGILGLGFKSETVVEALVWWSGAANLPLWNHEFCCQPEHLEGCCPAIKPHKMLLLHQKQSWSCEWPSLVPHTGWQLATNRLGQREGGRWRPRTEVEQWSQNALTLWEGSENLPLCGGEDWVDKAATGRAESGEGQRSGRCLRIHFSHRPSEWLCSYFLQDRSLLPHISSYNQTTVFIFDTIDLKLSPFGSLGPEGETLQL